MVELKYKGLDLIFKTDYDGNATIILRKEDRERNDKRTTICKDIEEGTGG